jgi:hypothetical protein
VIDTAAALTTGNFHFFAKVAKAFPHVVAKIFAPKDYSPIILSGIVQRGSETITTELTVAFEFHLPYTTPDGGTTSLLVATGPDVTVNTILGLPFIQATRMIIDAADQVAELRALDIPPFPIEWRRATVHVPHIEPSPVHIAQYQDVIQEVENLECFMADMRIAHSSVPPPSLRPRVHFGGPSVGSAATGNLVLSNQHLASAHLGIQPPNPHAFGQSVPARVMNDSMLNYHDPIMGDAQADLV